MQQQDMTEAQKAALPALLKRARRHSIAITISHYIAMFTGVTIIVAINEAMKVESLWFVGIGAFMTGIMCSNNASSMRKEATDKYIQELKDIK